MLAAREGVKSVIDLEWEEGDELLFPAIDVNDLRLKDFEPLPWFAPSLANDHVRTALRFLKTANPIVCVHCRSGQNRTGVVIAAYRLLVMKQPMANVLTDFISYRGIRARGDIRYIQSLPQLNDRLGSAV